MSRSLARASEHTVEPRTACAIAFTASKSPFDDAAKPASMTSTLSRSSWRAMRSFSSLVIEAPGDCSPSRKVVSKMIKRSVMAFFRGAETKRPAAFASGPLTRRGGEFVQRALGGRSRRSSAEARRASPVVTIRVITGAI